MKRRVSIVVLMVLLLNCANLPRHYLNYEVTEPIIISTHVGDTIYLEEREKYGLFMQVSGFRTATFYGIDGGGFEVRIITENEELVAVNRDPSAIELLNDYIDRYDAIRESRAQFEEQWKIVGYDELGLPITQHEVDRVRKNAGCIGCAAGAGILVAVPSTLLIVAGALADMDVSGWIPVAALGLVASGVLGAIIGRKIDRGAALKAIKKARKPQIVDKF
jgi:hypothetical protein